MSAAHQAPKAPSRVLAIVGPTATGKSDLAVAVALTIGAEVVNADSMQLYRGMDIGTAKLSSEQQQGVPHHLLDVLGIRETATVAAYQRAARSTVDEILQRGRTAILVGGSGLYVRAALDDLDFPSTDPDVRAELEAELAAHGSIPLHTRLAGVDPAAAASIHRHNGRKIVRALEVIALTGQPFRASMPEPRDRYRAVWLGLDDDPDVLDHRVESRVDRMWAQGLVGEVEQLAAAGLRDGVTASRALGYAQVLRHLDGEFSSEQARLSTAQATRRFVRRQRSWFRREGRIQWLSANDRGLVDRAVQAMDGSTIDT
ncbi:MAG: tRNA (adenosine(37)-N6)-dimethylallyltransferase MiaA [Geodermatophilaceae bacterium]|nr:tRNA (adenosine(37)-N6)-dimethylallyltransferase MiaA [Geodermatophilaceae bacterium]